MHYNSSDSNDYRRSLIKIAHQQLIYQYQIHKHVIKQAIKHKKIIKIIRHNFRYLIKRLYIAVWSNGRYVPISSICILKNSTCVLEENHRTLKEDMLEAKILTDAPVYCIDINRRGSTIDIHCNDYLSFEICIPRCSENTVIYMIAQNTNIFRIHQGMGSLAFAY